MSKGKFCEKDLDGKFCQGIVPCIKFHLSGSSEDREECQKQTGGFYGQNRHKVCKIPKNLNFSGLFNKEHVSILFGILNFFGMEVLLNYQMPPEF